MSAEQAVQATFDSVAGEYDQSFTHTWVGRAQREAVHSYLETVLGEIQPKAVLELNGGTGEDALWLAQRKLQVTCTDASPSMVDQMTQKVALAHLGQQIACRVLAFEDIASLKGKLYPMVFSNFGGLNCMPSGEWHKLGSDLAAVTQPGARLVIVLISKNCSWESLYFLSKMQLRKAFRRWSPKALARLDQHRHQMTWYPSQRQIRLALKQHWKVKAIRPIGLWVPPSYLENWARRHPAAFRVLATWDRAWRNVSVAAHFSDHILIDLERVA